MGRLQLSCSVRALHCNMFKTRVLTSNCAPQIPQPAMEALDFLSSGMEEDPRKGYERVISPTPAKRIPSWLPRGSTIGPRL